MPYISEHPSLTVLLYKPFLDKIPRKGLFGKTNVRAIELIDTQEQLYSIGAALGHALQGKLDILVDLLFIKDTKELKANEVMNLCKKSAEESLEKFMNEHGQEPDTFNDLVACLLLERHLRQHGNKLNAKAAIKAYELGDTRIKKILHKKGTFNDKLIRNTLAILLLQGINFGNSFPELTERMYQRAQEENASLISKWHAVDVPEEFKAMTLEETERAILQKVASYASKYHPELIAPLGL